MLGRPAAGFDTWTFGPAEILARPPRVIAAEARLRRTSVAATTFRTRVRPARSRRERPTENTASPTRRTMASRRDLAKRPSVQKATQPARWPKDRNHRTTIEVASPPLARDLKI